VIVRPSQPDEVDQVLRLWRESGRRAGATDDRAALTALLKRDPEAVLVAELDRRMVGSLIATWDGWRGNMYRLTVHPTIRRKGIARRLVEAGEKRLRAAGARRITALVSTEDSRAVHIWLAAGYEHDLRTGRFVKTMAA
jgi:ribosomal protein S18 acetylase RimI-like enzyme